MSLLSPVVLFVYNRPVHTKKTIEALKNNVLADETPLIINIDYPKKESDKELVNQVDAIVSDVKGFKSVEIIRSRINKGVDKSVIEVTTKVVCKYGKIIVLEDDHVTSVNFLSFMNDALNRFEDVDQIFGVSGYSPPIVLPDFYRDSCYLAARNSSWGWGTWKRKWLDVDWSSNNYSLLRSSKKLRLDFCRGGSDMYRMLVQAMEIEAVPFWDIRASLDMFIKGRYFLYPTKNYVLNIGMDGSGEHSGVTSHFNNELDSGAYRCEFPDNLVANKSVQKKFYLFYSDGRAKRFIFSIFDFLNVTLFLLKVRIFIKKLTY